MTHIVIQIKTISKALFKHYNFLSQQASSHARGKDITPYHEQYMQCLQTLINVIGCVQGNDINILSDIVSLIIPQEEEMHSSGSRLTPTLLPQRKRNHSSLSSDDHSPITAKKFFHCSQVHDQCTSSPTADTAICNSTGKGKGKDKAQDRQAEDKTQRTDEDLATSALSIQGIITSNILRSETCITYEHFLYYSTHTPDI